MTECFLGFFSLQRCFDFVFFPKSKTLPRIVKYLSDWQFVLDADTVQHDLQFIYNIKGLFQPCYTDRISHL